MKRSLGYERTFWSKQYETVKASDVIDDIPDELVMNEEFIKLIRMYQILGTEVVFKKFKVLESILPKEHDSAIETLTKLKDDVFADLTKLLETYFQKDE